MKGMDPLSVLNLEKQQKKTKSSISPVMANTLHEYVYELGLCEVF